MLAGTVHKYEISKVHVRFRNVHLYGITLNYLYSNDNLKSYTHKVRFNIILKSTRIFGIKFFYLKLSNQNILPTGHFTIHTICKYTTISINAPKSGSNRTMQNYILYIFLHKKPK